MPVIYLNQKIEDFEGKPIMEPEKNREMILKDILVGYLAFFQSQNGEDLIASSVLAHKVFKSVGKLDLTDAEMKIIKMVTKTPRHVAFVYASMMDAIDPKAKLVPVSELVSELE